MKQAVRRAVAILLEAIETDARRQPDAVGGSRADEEPLRRVSRRGAIYGRALRIRPDDDAARKPWPRSPERGIVRRDLLYPERQRERAVILGSVDQPPQFGERGLVHPAVAPNTSHREGRHGDDRNQDGGLNDAPARTRRSCLGKRR